MMSFKIKICGMRDPDNIRAVMRFNPDYMGFIFYPSSPRFVGTAFALPDDFPTSIKRAGVFVNATRAAIKDKVDRFQLHAVQLHGDEPAELCDHFKKEGLEVIKVFRMDDSFDFKTIDAYRNSVTHFLFDTKGERYGGNAKTFDWRLLNQYDQEVPFFLSGGLRNEMLNKVAELQVKNLYALDFNSGIEKFPGLKDVDKVTELFSTLKHIELKNI